MAPHSIDVLHLYMICRREAAAAVARKLRERLPIGESVDKAEKDFTDAVVRTAELVIPRKRRKRVGRGWSGDAKHNRNSRRRRQICILLGATSKQTPRMPNSGKRSAGLVKRSRK